MAFSLSVNRPVDSMTMSTPRAFHGKRGEVLDRANALDLVAVDDEHVGFFERGVALFRADGVLELAVDGIIFHLVGEIVGVGGHVHDGDDVN